MKIVDTFHITGRGLVVATAQATGAPVGRRLTATVIRPNGTTITADAFKEHFARRESGPVECDAFLIVGVSKADVPIGSELELQV